MGEKIVATSGYFDATVYILAIIELMREAKKLGDKLIVIVNNDKQAHLKRDMNLCLSKKELR